MNNNKKDRVPAKGKQQSKVLVGTVDSNTAASNQVKGLLNKLDDMRHFIADMDAAPPSKIIDLLRRIESFLRDPYSCNTEHQQLLEDVQEALMNYPAQISNPDEKADKEAALQGLKYMTIVDAAKELGVTVYTIDGWIRRGHIKSTKIGKRRLVGVELSKQDKGVFNA